MNQQGKTLMAVFILQTAFAQLSSPQTSRSAPPPWCNNSWSVSIWDWFQMRRCFHQPPQSCSTLLFHSSQDPNVNVQGCYWAAYRYTIPICHLMPFKTLSAIPPNFQLPQGARLQHIQCHPCQLHVAVSDTLGHPKWHWMPKFRQMHSTLVGAVNPTQPLYCL